jgi:hypothetical protein
MKNFQIEVCSICKKMTFIYNMHSDICVFCYANHEDQKMSINRYHLTLQTDFADKERDEVILQTVVDFAKQLVATAALIGVGNPAPKVKVVLTPFMQGDINIPVTIDEPVGE